MDLTNFHRGVGRGAAWHLALLLLAADALPATAQLAPVVVSPPFRVGEPGVECWSAGVRAVGPDSVEVSAMTGAGLVSGRLAWPGAWFDDGVLAPAGRAIGGASPVANPPGLLAFADERALGLAAVRVGQWRTVVVSPDRGREGAGAFNDGLPVVVYTDDGTDWKPDPGVALVTPLRLGSVALAAPMRDAPGEGNNAGVRGDTPRGVDRQRHAPSVAVRRIDGDSDEVYVAFCARTSRSSTNTDVYIARSVNAETSAFAFPSPGFPNFLHLTDTLLGTPTGTDGADQFVPAIAIDSCGGVNLMFYDNRHDPDRTDSVELVDVYYARIADYGTGGETVTQHRLTPQSIRVDNLGGNRFLGDSHNLTVSADGTTIYAAYIARDSADPVTGDRTCYVHRIDINCSGPLAEMTGDGAVTEADAAAFATAWAAGEPEADTNLDMAVDADDLVNYLITYSEEIE